MIQQGSSAIDSISPVHAGDVLEHLREPRDTLRRLSRNLKPDGRLIASVPNVAHHTVIRGLLADAVNANATGRALTPN
jgi:2-polyprenyl-3-methyl-5-hydroxy-6-metoxy-1,4-benzoquinol methylase